MAEAHRTIGSARGAVALVALALGAGCSASTAASGDGGDPNDPRSCGAGVMAVPYEGATHIPEPTPIAYAANPPASGPHWPVWSPWGAFTDVVPRERWVHNLEHGGIVLLYNCPPDGGAIGDGAANAACPEVAQSLAFLRSERSNDKFGVVRVLVTPDPLLPARVGAVAWLWSWVGDAVDLDLMRCFIARRYGRGPEDAP